MSVFGWLSFRRPELLSVLARTRDLNIAAQQVTHVFVLVLIFAEAGPGTAEPSMISLQAAAGPSLSALSAGPADSGNLVAAASSAPLGGSAVTLATFKQLLDRLLQQKADMVDLLQSSSIDIVRLNVGGLKQGLLPWPVRRLAELHQALPVLAAGGV